MDILVTGSQGFIGKSFVDYVEKAIGPGLELSTYDKLDRKNHDFSKVFDVGILLGALKSVPASMLYPEKYLSENLASVIDYATNCRKVIFASSSSVYGDSKYEWKTEGDEKHSKCLSPYALSKKQGEEILELFNSIYGLPYIALRFFNVYGPGQKSGVIIDWIKSALEKNEITIYGNGENIRDYTYIDDINEAIYLATINEMESGVYNVGASAPISLASLADIFKMLIPGVVVKFADARAGDVRVSASDSFKFKKLTDWEPKTGLVEGIEKTLNWYKGASSSMNQRRPDRMARIN